MQAQISKEEMQEQYDLATISTLFEMPSMSGVPAYSNVSGQSSMANTHSRSISSESASSLVETAHPSRTHPSLQPYNQARPPTNEFLSPDASTHRRRYATASSPSQRNVPPYVTARRRSAQQISDEEDELFDEPLPDNATEQQKVEYRRKQNTLAARRSRKRRMLQFQKLEEDVVRLTREKDIWRERALMMERLLATHGLPFPNFDS
ncbi:hypothetical protein CPB84DRAFT_1542741 [Gymnopilus junonius]|uniref:BZIP domain-containing protein n=1 Tax=Gymnopilus junonius TaxID=109634 RepID=A0A9P5NGJ6_GYMJU|nr:hypothetical protein CPB84DRAFT_1542741 [Gymnopilus junonius]